MAKTDADVEIIWRAYELRPEPVPTLPPGGEYLQNAWKNSVLPLAEKLGVRMNLPPVQPRSRLAHEAAKWGQTQGKFDEMNAAIFRAFFERGENIGETPVLVSLAANLDLEGELLRGALASGEFTESVIADEDAAEMIGVSGVPAFVADRRTALSGVQPLENLQRLVRHAQTLI